VTTVFQRVGPYEIVREIGRGGMAAVFLAEDSRQSRQVALKLVPISLDREGHEILEAERWGARLQERLAEACGMVPRVYEEGDQPPYYFIAMEYVQGENLSDVIARGPASAVEATRIASALCRFLDTAHRFKTSIDGREFWSLVHGDLKPRNVRLSETGDIKVLDFGIAKALSLSRKVTRNDFGSMPYLSPERLESTAVDARADLWALGVILYELLAASPPFQAVDTRRLEQQIRAGYARRPLPATCPIAMQAIVSRLLAPEPRDRYESASAVLSDLGLFEAGHPPQALTDGFPRPLDEAATRRTRPPVDPASEATRRTERSDVPPAAPDAATRATTAQPEAPTPAAPPTTRTAAVPAAPIQVKPRRSHPLRTFLMLAALFLVCNELVVGFKANRVAASVMTRDLDGMDDLWGDYQLLSHRSYLRLGVAGLEQTLASRVRSLAELVIANYRSTQPTVRERQWRMAQRNLQQALVLAPRSDDLKSSLRYCEGHLHRIDGEAEKLRHHAAAANQHFTEAVTAFREAAELRRDWPDPFLGLARTFIYGLEDIDRAADALKQAQKLGYTTGDRETAQLADGYRARGDSLWQTSRRLADMPQELEYLQRAGDAYRQAQGLYERIPGFPGVAANLRRTQKALGQIDERTAERAAERVVDREIEDPGGVVPSADGRTPDRDQPWQ
jgi:serine/threonine protein kinase/tetratricopeptide (TPR) repeat protein